MDAITKKNQSELLAFIYIKYVSSNTKADVFTFLRYSMFYS